MDNPFSKMAYYKEQHAYMQVLNRYVLNGLDGTMIVRHLKDNDHLWKRIFVADRYHLNWEHWPQRTESDIQLQNRRPVDEKTIYLMPHQTNANPKPSEGINDLKTLAEVCGASSYNWQKMPFHNKEREVFVMTFDNCIQYEWRRHQLLLKENPNVPQLWLDAGKYREEHGDLQGALEHYQKAMGRAHWQEKLGFLEHIGRIYTKQEKFSAATQAYLLARDMGQKVFHSAEHTDKLQRITAKINAFLDSNTQNATHHEKNVRLLESTHLERATLYYPGSGFDFGPLCLFANLPGLENVVYAEYGMGDALEALQAEMHKNIPEFEVMEVSMLSPAYFDAPDWEVFWHPQSERDTYVRQKSFGVKFKLRKENKILNFYFLGTEGVATCKVLLKAGFNIQVMVLQEHGFGGGWTKFEGDSTLYQTHKNSRALPKMLLVAENTSPWPGYANTNMPVLIQRGQMHAHRRSIFLQK